MSIRPSTCRCGTAGMTLRIASTMPVTITRTIPGQGMSGWGFARTLINKRHILFTTPYIHCCCPGVSSGIHAGRILALMGFSPDPALAEVRQYKLSRTTETRNTCPYCSVGCGILMYGLGDGAKNATASIIHIEGDPDHPVNRGTLCPKGASLIDFIHSPSRLLYPEYRGARLRSVAAHFVGRRARPHRETDEGRPRRQLRRKDADGKTVNRWLTTGMLAHRRPATKWATDAQGRAQHGDAGVRQPGACLTRSDGGRSCPDVWPWSDDEPLGRHQECGRDPHHGRQCRRGAPVRLQVGDEAKAHNKARLIVVDPRFTRSASVADYYAPIRTGTDIVFLGGVINYLLTTTRSSTSTCETTRTSRSSCARTLPSTTASIPATTPTSTVRQVQLGLRAWRRRLCEGRHDAAASALRLQPAEAALLALHA
jgi:hypothetical protein